MFCLLLGRIPNILINTNSHIPLHDIVKGALESDSDFEIRVVTYYLYNLGQLLNLFEPESAHLQK